MLRKLLFVVFVILVFSAANLNAGEIYRSINDRINLKQRYMDLKSFAYLVTEKQRWNLIISCDVSVPQKELVGSTIKEILDNYCKNSEFGWRFVGGCLYIANERELKTFFQQLPILETHLPDYNHTNAVYSGYFKSIDLSMLCMFLSSLSGTQIRVANGFEPSIMMRVSEMSWKKVLLAIVHLNRFKLTISDYSVLISPENSSY